MLRQLHRHTIPTAISIAFFEATFFIIARVLAFSGREIVLGVIAGAIGGICVLVAVLWQGWGCGSRADRASRCPAAGLESV